MSLKGMKGTKKLKSIFIDHKIPIDRRETWPVVTDGKNRILWLPGLKKCYDADTLDKGEGCILITYRLNTVVKEHLTSFREVHLNDIDSINGEYVATSFDYKVFYHIDTMRK